MGRWEPGASNRLRHAALELFVEQGFEQTTVAEIAQRAGLTARTFFRYFSDKREVLFGSTDFLEQHLLGALATAPATAAPIEAIATAVEAAAEVLTEHAWSAKRQSVIVANAELRERELIKMATLSAALAGGLRSRGVDEPDASLAAETGVAVFRVAFERWVAEPDDRGLAKVIAEAFTRLRALGIPTGQDLSSGQGPTPG